MAFLIVVLVVVSLALAGILFNHYVYSTAESIENLEVGQSEITNKLNEREIELAQMKAQLEEMKSCARRKHNPYQTNAGLEDAIAVLMDAKEAKEVADLFYKQKATYLDVRLESAMSALRKIRQDPSSYDMEAPNGKRGVE